MNRERINDLMEMAGGE